MKMNGGGTVLATAIGPRLTGIDDLDETAGDAHLEIVVEPPEQALGLRPSWRSFDDPWEIGGVGSWRPADRSLVTLRSFVRACAAGNVTLISALFAPDGLVLHSSPVGDCLRRDTACWTGGALAKTVVYRLKRAERVCFEGTGEGDPRNWDRVARVLAEAEMAVELFRDERITMPIQEPARSWIESVAEGAVSVADVRERLAAMIRRVERAPLQFTQPPSELGLQQWMIEVYLGAWSTWRPMGLE